MRLGWRNPRPNDFQTPDLRPLRDQFGNLQQFFTWPHIHLQNFGGTLLAGGGLTTIGWTTELDDPYTLRVSGANIFVPQDFDTWLVMGKIVMRTDGAGGTGRRFVGLRVNTTLGFNWDAAYFTGAAAEAPHVGAPVAERVKKGDVLDVVASNNAAGNDTNVDLEMFLMFLPMT